jgi:hypothetical protein
MPRWFPAAGTGYRAVGRPLAGTKVPVSRPGPAADGGAGLVTFGAEIFKEFYGRALLDV